MPFVQIDDVCLHFRTDGDAARPCLIFSNSLGTDLGMWDAQAAALSRDFFVLRYDTRGHGQSRGSGILPDLDRLGKDVVGLLDALEIESADLCGISMGGLTGLWLAIHARHRLRRLVVANSAARIGSPAGWRDRAALVRAQGMQPVADGAADRWFTPAFRKRSPTVVAGLIGALAGSDPDGYAASCLALASADLRADIAGIATPTLLIGGRYDPVTTMDDARSMQTLIRDACIVELPASHLSNVEAEAEFTRSLRQFLE